MIYTCYDMARDCREDRAEGWRYLAANYVPVIRKLLAHYSPPQQPAIEEVLRALKRPESSLFHSQEPLLERVFVAELRQTILAGLRFSAPELPLDLDTVAAAFEPLTVAERQAAWTESMGHTAEAAGAMLRMAPGTIAKIRDRAAELLRGHADRWRRSILRENGPELGRAAYASRTAECPPSKAFLDVLDGRTPWSGREQMEPHVRSCLHCVDHFCRMAEAIELLRSVRPLSDSEAAPYYDALGIAAPKRTGWRLLLPV